MKEAGYKTVVGEECYYQKYDEEGKLIGMVLTHLDDFIYNGTEQFAKELEELLKEK